MAGPESDRHRVLVVEGADDEHVVRHLHDRLSLGLNFDIRQAGGVDPLIDSIRGEVAGPGRIAVGFVVDADDNPDRRWQTIAGKLETREILTPNQTEAAGTIVEANGGPRVGIWLMPDNAASGALEEFVAKMVPADDPVWPLAEGYIGKVPEDALFVGRSKAEMRAWLATRKRPLMGANIGAGRLNTDCPLCRSFAAWLTRLFG